MVTTQVQERIYEFFSRYPLVSHPKGTVVIDATISSPDIYFLETGTVQQYALSKQGEEMGITLYKPHTFFPIIPLFSGKSNRHFFQTVSVSSIRKAPRATVHEFITDHPEVQLSLIHRLSLGMEGMLLRLESLLAGSAQDKLFTSLVLLAQRFGMREKTTMILPPTFTEKDIATYSGIRRETVSRGLQELKKSGQIEEKDGSLRIPNINEIDPMGLL